MSKEHQYKDGSKREANIRKGRICSIYLFKYYNNVKYINKRDKNKL